MEQLTIKLSQKAFDELVETVVEVNDEDNPTKVTLEEYAGNIVEGQMLDRMRGEFVHVARTADLDELEQKHGKVRELRQSRKQKQSIPFVPKGTTS